MDFLRNGGQSADNRESTVIRMEGFHVAMNYFAVLGKKYQLSGIVDLLI